MIWNHLLTHSLLFAFLVNGYLLLVMVSTSPRVWGYSDYSDEIKAKVPAQTREERRLATIIAIPWMLFAFGYPFYSTYLLKSDLGGEIPFWIAFLNVLALVTAATLGDLVILDWLIINKITPRFVIMPGTERADYQDFTHHYRAHARAAVFLVLICFVYASAVWFF
jgi:hypothetical protein